MGLGVGLRPPNPAVAVDVHQFKLGLGIDRQRSWSRALDVLKRLVNEKKY